MKTVPGLRIHPHENNYAEAKSNLWITQRLFTAVLFASSREPESRLTSACFLHIRSCAMVPTLPLAPRCRSGEGCGEEAVGVGALMSLAPPVGGFGPATG
jgi:hypothetical protein